MANQLSTARADRGPTSGIHSVVTQTPKPLLASEVLREEIAPIEPARRMSRLWLGAIALGLALLGVAVRLGIGSPALDPGAGTIAFSAGGAAVAVAVLPFPYALRAAVSFLLGGVLMLLGMRGAGPLAGLAVDGGFALDAARLVTVTVLPAALLFRARYRAYGRARALLATALALSLPFVVMEVMLSLNGSAPLVARIFAAANVAVVLCALFGFLGEGTTGAGSFWAALVLAFLPAELAVRELTPLADADTGLLTYPATAVGMLLAALLASLGLFQLLAAVFAGDARRVSMSRARIFTHTNEG
jgi:hypothetical protein